MKTSSEIERQEQQQQRQTSTSTGESLDDVRYRNRMSISDDIATMARVEGNVIHYTGQGTGQGVSAGTDAYKWINEGEDEDEPEAPVDEEVYEETQKLMRRGASRSRSPGLEPEERASGSSDATRFLRRGASRSHSSTPPDVNTKFRK